MIKYSILPYLGDFLIMKKMHILLVEIMSILFSKAKKISLADIIASFALIAAVALNLLFPQSLGAYFETANSSAEHDIYGAKMYDDVFLSDIEGPEFKDEFQAHIINDNTLLAFKSPPNKDYVVSSRMWLFVTAYSSTPDQTDSTPFIMASGNHVYDGAVAANFLPLGTKVRFPTLYGDKVFTVEDRMNKRYYYKADVWMPTRWQAQQFGLRNVPIEVLREI